MKIRLYIIIISVIIGISVYSQSTISYITGSCVAMGNGSNTNCPAGINFLYLGDTLKIYGTISASCCGTHLAVISSRYDSIYIIQKDSGVTCECICNYCFEIKIPKSLNDSIVSINEKAYLIQSASAINSNNANTNFRIYPNPTTDLIFIDCGNNYNGYKIRITNSLSQTIYKTLITKQTTAVNLKTWTGRGMYFVALIDENNTIIETQKIVLK